MFSLRGPLVVPSEPVAADDSFHGYQIFEQVRRPTIGGRRCSPARSSFVAVERVVHEGQLGVLLRRAHPCDAGRAIAEDLANPLLSRVGVERQAAITEDDGHVCVVFAGCPGVRLRALAERCFTKGVSLSDEVVWHLLRRTQQLVDAWSRVGIEPIDTLIAFDGSVHLFPHLAVCERSEIASYAGNEVFDPFLVSTRPESLAELMCGWLPRPWLETVARMVIPFGDRECAVPPPKRSERLIPPLVENFLGRAASDKEAGGAIADLVRRMFPQTHERHRRMYTALHLDPEQEGLGREQRVLAAGEPPGHAG